MLLCKLLLLPFAVASSVTVYVHSLPAGGSSSSPLPSPVPLAQIEYDAVESSVSLRSYSPPTGSYSKDHLLRVGLSDPKTGDWRGVVTSAASFAQDYKKNIAIHVDETGNVYHVGFGTSARDKGDEVEVELVKRASGPRPALNKPVVLNAEGKVNSQEPEKTFLQKYWWAIALFIVVQLVSGGGDK